MPETIPEEVDENGVAQSEESKDMLNGSIVDVSSGSHAEIEGKDEEVLSQDESPDLADVDVDSKVPSPA
jgi:hypothetical protein